MLRKFAVATAIAGAALAFSAGPALAHSGANSGDQNYNQNLQAVAATVCNANVGAVIGAAVPVLSPQTVFGPCVNGPIQTIAD